MPSARCFRGRPARSASATMFSNRKGTQMAAKKSGRRVSGARANEGNDAIELLTEDHRRVDELFEEYESAKDEAEDEAKEELVARICLELTVHATVEEEIFYPAAREGLDAEDSDMLDEA